MMAEGTVGAPTCYFCMRIMYTNTVLEEYDFFWLCNLFVYQLWSKSAGRLYFVLSYVWFKLITLQALCLPRIHHLWKVLRGSGSTVTFKVALESFKSDYLRRLRRKTLQ
jgi:hypothetical protein